jgi:hypothetical protein
MDRIQTESGASSSSQRASPRPDRQELIETSRLNSGDELNDFSAAWAELVERQRSSTIFQTYKLHDSWWKAFGDDHELLVILCRRNGRLVAIAPVMVRIPPLLRADDERSFVSSVASTEPLTISTFLSIRTYRKPWTRCWSTFRITCRTLIAFTCHTFPLT